MYFFDYFFYRISSAVQESKIEKEHPEASGRPIVTLFQMFNLMALLFFTFNIKMTISVVSYTWIPAFIINWLFFFNRKMLNKYRGRWDDEDRKSRRLKGWLIIAYMIVSVVLFCFALSKM